MRKPEYTEDGVWRIVSVPNELWRLQRHSQVKGSKTIDPWEDKSPAVSYGAARELLAFKEPLQAKKGMLA